MKKKLSYILAALAAIVLIATFVALWRNSRPKKIEYDDLKATTATIRRTSLLTGKIIPRDEVNIKPQISGIISELCKKAGETVTEGEVIAKVKVIPDMNSLSSAQSRVRLSEINLKQAKTNFEREKALYDKSLVSADEYEKIRQAYEQAREEYAAAKESLEVVRDGVSSSNRSSSSTLVRSTVSGLILDIPVKVGTSVILSNTFNDGTTVATVADMNDLIFDGYIDETEVGKIKEGTPMTITVGAIDGLSLSAVTEYISPKAKENNGTNEFEVKAAVTVPEGATIRSGYSANAEIVLDMAEDVLTIPEAAVQFEGENSYVLVKQANGSYERKDVETGLSDGINIEVKSGLTGDETLRGNRKPEKK